jgi:sulfite exporter TauE/SafE
MEAPVESLETADAHRDQLEQEVKAQLRFQRRWRLISMSAYVITTVGTILCTVGATFFAVKGLTDLAAILSGIATISVGIEKSLLFREKWKFHLLMHTKLNVLQARMLLGRLTIVEAADEFAAIMGEYAAELPMSAREQS